MISDADRTTISELARKYGARRVLLFGSSAQPDVDGRDIDLAVEGVPDDQFFKFYGELIFALSKPVDVVDLGKRSSFTAIIRDEGVPVHG